jgi:RNA polymerase sigma factor (sigma-70 family)
MATIDYNKLINDNMGLVKSIVRKFRPKSKLEHDEYLQCGRIGLWEAARIHKPELGAFSTIAYPRIVWEILAQIKKHDKFKSRHPEYLPNEYIGTHNVGDIIQSFWETMPENLTEEELNIIVMLSQGYKRNEIYKEIGISQTKFDNVLNTAIRKIKRANKNEKNPVM